MEIINLFRHLYARAIYNHGFIILLCLTRVKADHCPRANAKDFFEDAAQIRDQRNISLDATLDYLLSRCM